MIKKVSIFTITVLLILSTLISCNRTSNNDNTSNKLRVISLAPNVTEILCALDAEDYLIGRTDYCNYPSSVKNIQSIGDMYSPNIEMIVSLKPDMVIASSIVSSDIVDILNNAGIKTYQFFHEYEGINGLYTLITEIAQAINKNDVADSLIKDLKERQEKVRCNKQNTEKSCALLITWGEWGDYAATGETFLDDVIKTAGAINIASESNYWAISKELLMATDPDIIFITDDSNYVTGDICESFKNTKPYSDLSASKNNKVYVLNNDMTSRLSIRTIDTLEIISGIINQ